MDKHIGTLQSLPLPLTCTTARTSPSVADAIVSKRASSCRPAASATGVVSCTAPSETGRHNTR